MKALSKTLLFFLSLFVLACGGDGSTESNQSDNAGSAAKTETAAPESNVPASQRVDLNNKGVGPVTSVTLNDDIDRKLAVEGKKVFDQMCMACHKPDTRLIGPAPKDILERRTPEWVMNMILNPEVMVKEDPLARDLLMEFNGSPMSNQGLNEEEARAILEYFRTL